MESASLSQRSPLKEWGDTAGVVVGDSVVRGAAGRGRKRRDFHSRAQRQGDSSTLDRS